MSNENIFRHGQVAVEGDEYNKDTMYYCDKCGGKHTREYFRCDAFRTGWQPQSGIEPTAAASVGTALSQQVAGNHYKDLKIQPVEYIHANQLGFCEGSVVKYVTRWRSKGGLKDLEKARHFLDLLIELEVRKAKP